MTLVLLYTYIYIYIYINSTYIPPIMMINGIDEHKNLLSLRLVSLLVGLRTYQHPCNVNEVTHNPENQTQYSSFISALFTVYA